MKEKAAKLNPKQEKFCQLYHKSGNASQSYKDAGYGSESDEACRSNASKLITKDNVEARLRELRAEQAQNCSLSRSDIVEKLCNVITALPDEAGLDNPLCELKITAQGPVAVFPDMLGSVKELNRMLGHYEPEKLDITVEGELVDMLRGLTGA